MNLIIAILLLVMPASAQTATTDRPQVKREVMSVLDAFVDAFNHQDARAEERTYHFPHYRLASGQMAVFDTPGAATETWMNNTYRTLRDLTEAGDNEAQNAVEVKVSADLSCQHALNEPTSAAVAGADARRAV